MLYDINQTATNTAPSAGGGLAPGDYPAVLETPVKKDWEGRVFYEIPFTLSDGTGRKGNVSIWDFDDNDRREAANDPKAAERIERAIARHKRLFVDVGVWSRDQASSAAWDAGDHSVIGALRQLTGRKCHVVVVKRKDDPAKTTTYINAPRDDVQQAPGSNAPAAQPPGTTSAPSAPPSLSDIPF